MNPNFATRPFSGHSLFIHFKDKGWWALRHSESRYITFTPPARFANAHRVRIMVPVIEPFSFELDPSRPFFGSIMGNNKDQNGNVGIDFEVKADWDNPAKWTAFAVWIGELLNNPGKFYNED